MNLRVCPILDRNGHTQKYTKQRKGGQLSGIETLIYISLYIFNKKRCIFSTPLFILLYNSTFKNH